MIVAEARRETDEERRHVNPAEVLRILEKHSLNGGNLIANLEGVRRTYGYVPELALKLDAGEANRSSADICGVASFYE